jgi:hypothetical protein
VGEPDESNVREWPTEKLDADREAIVGESGGGAEGGEA